MSMLRFVVAGFAAALTLSAAAFASTQPVEGPDVVVFPDEALVTHRRQIACGSRIVAAFPELPAAADDGRLVARTNLGVVDGVRRERRARPDRFAAALTVLDEQRRATAAQLATAKAEAASREAGVKAVDGLQEVSTALLEREVLLPDADPRRWRAALLTVLDEGARANERLVTASARVLALARTQIRLEEEATAVRRRATTPELSVEVVLSCPVGRTAEVSLGTFVPARFTMAHELRATSGASTVELATFATLTQATGLAWQDARVSLSTARPRSQAAPLLPAPIVVWAAADGGRQTATHVEDVPDAPSFEGPARAGPVRVGGAAPTGLAVAGQGASVRWELPSLATVPGDGTPVRVLVARRTLPAETALVTTPGLSLHVFEVARTSNVVNGAPNVAPILAGPIDVFRDGAFVARRTLPQVAPGERFTVTLGVEERVPVSRKILAESQRSAGLFGGRERHDFAYRLEVTSHAPVPVRVEVAEQLPTTELADVTIALDPRTSPGHVRDARDGVLRWPLVLQPHRPQTLHLVFHVDAPAE